MFAYLGQTLASDRKALRAQRRVLSKASASIDEAFEQNAYDFTGPAVSTLFDTATTVAYADLATQDGKHII